jgi:hypothetical protein
VLWLSVTIAGWRRHNNPTRLRGVLSASWCFHLQQLEEMLERAREDARVGGQPCNHSAQRRQQSALSLSGRNECEAIRLTQSVQSRECEHTVSSLSLSGRNECERFA